MKTHRHIKHILQHIYAYKTSQPQCTATVWGQYSHSSQFTIYNSQPQCGDSTQSQFTVYNTVQYSMETVYSSPSGRVPSLETFEVKSDIALLAFEETPKVFSIVS